MFKKNILITILTSLGIVVLVVIIGLFLCAPEEKEEITEINDWKTYRNEEWGFEFQYPEDWILREKVFKSYYSKFNLDIVVKKDGLDPAFLVNIVLPEFADRSFRGIEKTTSEITVAGVQGVKYEFEFEGFSHTVVILSFGEYKIILATGEGSKQYLNEFNQILETFKFLR